MFSGSFLWNNNHSVLLDIFYIILYLESDRFKTPSVLRILLVCLAIEENCSWRLQLFDGVPWNAGSSFVIDSIFLVIRSLFVYKEKDIQYSSVKEKPEMFFFL